VTTNAGRLLVAAQGLVDPNFARTVVLLLEHDDDGAFGLVLNRPGALPLTEALAPWAAQAAQPPVIFTGGPVQSDGVLALGRTREPADAAPHLPGVEVVDLGGDPALAAARYRGIRLFAGYAGWGGEQLEAEVAAGGWYLVDAHPTDVLTSDPDGLWRFVLARQGGLFLTITEDPSLN
jgi:putative transcriptional regulator